MSGNTTRVVRLAKAAQPARRTLAYNPGVPETSSFVSRPEGDRCPGVLRLVEAADGFLARVRLPGGLVSGGQLRVLAGLADELGDGRVELTSRGNVQLRGLAADAAETLTDELTRAGLLPSLSHDRVRNVLASPLAGLDGGPDLSGIVRALDAALCARPRLAQLSGRFLFAVDDGRGDVSGLGADVVATLHRDDTVLNDTRLNGTRLNGTRLNGTRLNGTRLNGTWLNDAMVNGPAVNSTVVSDDPVNGPAVNSTVVSDAVVNGPAVNSTVVSGAVVNSTVVNSTVLNGAVVNSTVLNGAVVNGAVVNGAVVNGAVVNGAVVNGAVVNGAVVNVAVVNGAVGNDAVVNGAVVNGAVVNGAVVNGAVVNGAVVNSTVLNDDPVNGPAVNDALVNDALVNDDPVNNAMNEAVANDAVRQAVVNGLLISCPADRRQDAPGHGAVAVPTEAAGAEQCEAGDAGDESGPGSNAGAGSSSDCAGADGLTAERGPDRDKNAGGGVPDALRDAIVDAMLACAEAFLDLRAEYGGTAWRIADLPDGASLVRAAAADRLGLDATGQGQPSRAGLADEPRVTDEDLQGHLNHGHLNHGHLNHGCLNVAAERPGLDAISKQPPARGETPGRPKADGVRGGDGDGQMRRGTSGAGMTDIADELASTPAPDGAGVSQREPRGPVLTRPDSGAGPEPDALSATRPELGSATPTRPGPDGSSVPRPEARVVLATALESGAAPATGQDQKPGTTPATPQDQKPGAAPASRQDQKPGAAPATPQDQKPGTTPARRPTAGAGPVGRSGSVDGPVSRPVGLVTAGETVGDGESAAAVPLDRGESVVLLAPLGRLTSAQVGWVADRLGGGVARVTPWRSVVLPWPTDAPRVLREAAGLGFGTDAGSPWLRVTACAGRPGCAKALADVQADAAGLAARWPGRIVHVSGCARHCGRPAATEIDVTATSEGYQVAGV
jgi:uncharacterized protein YjbI with pentapeptide repeats